MQNASFSDQISSINVTDASYCYKVVIYLIFCECETKMVSKMAALMKKSWNFQTDFIDVSQF